MQASPSPPQLTDATSDTWPYTLLEQIGSGASGSSWLARSAAGLTALKIGNGPAERARFAGEAQRLVLAGSPALPELLGAGLLPPAPRAALKLPRGVPYLALEWLPGAALRPRSVSEGERQRLAWIVARDVGRALADLHAAGVAHGDVKPENVVFDPLSGRARLVDLGLAEAVTERRVRGGTPRYLAPETRTAALDGDAGARDLWALGVTIAELALAAVADSDTPGAAAAEARFEPALDRLLRPLLRPAPGARPSADWVHRRAAAALGGVETNEARRARGLAELKRAYLGARRPWLDRVLAGESLDITVGGLAKRWLEEAASAMRQIAELRGVEGAVDTRRVVVEDLGQLGQERLLSKWLGPRARQLGWFVSSSDAELLERLAQSIREQSPHSLAGLVVPQPSRITPELSEDPVALAIALAEGAPDRRLLELAERYVLEHPEQSALGRLVAHTLALRGELGRALAVLDVLSEPEAQLQAAEIARRANDDADARRRLQALDPRALDPKQQARAAATRARLELRSGDAAAARRALAGAPEGCATLEVEASLALRAGDLRRAEHCVRRAQAETDRPDELARLECVAGSIEHARHQYAAALARFARAADHAVRAGAVLEEATYLVGVAAAASELGQLRQALEAAERALVLFEYLGRPEPAARAALARASVLLAAGAREEALDAATEALELARQGGDVRCQAFAHLALAEARSESKLAALDHLERAAQLAARGGEPRAREDALRIAAQRLELGGDVDAASCDSAGADPALSAEARLAWWGARARREPGPRGAEVLARLVSLVSAHAAVGVRGPAFAAGARLAAALGDGELARRFSLLATESARTLRAALPPGLEQRFELCDWVRSVDVAPARQVAPEQIRDVETLVRALTTKNSLRSLSNQVLDALVLWTGVERGLLLLRAPGGRLVPRAARNVARADLNPAQLELSHSLAERAIATREPVVAVDAVSELPEHHQSVHALKLRSLLAIPLFFKGETLGVVYLDDRVRAGAFGPDELAWVRLVASIAAVAIGDARDQLLLRRAARRAERAALRAARAERELRAALNESEAERDAVEQRLAQTAPRRTRFRYEQIIGESPALRQVLALVDRVTLVDVPVLILGESGTGKELIARALHDNGPRAARPFVSENCSAIPETLLESTLFGHVRGAFTGAARNHAGLFSVADQGTLFLDEIGEMSLTMQAKLLRVLQTGEVRPLGSERTQHVDVRVVAATQRDLEAMVAKGTFREDLFYRLNVVSLRLPALRERRSDIPLLARHFLAKYSSGLTPTLSDAALSLLEAYAWPGNVRELENETRRALVMASGSSQGETMVITPEHLSPKLSPAAAAPPRPDDLNVRARVDRLEAELVRTALEKTSGNQTKAAELLGLSRFGLQKMMKRLGIERAAS